MNTSNLTGLYAEFPDGAPSFPYSCALSGFFDLLGNRLRKVAVKPGPMMGEDWEAQDAILCLTIADLHADIFVRTNTTVLRAPYGPVEMWKRLVERGVEIEFSALNTGEWQPYGQIRDVIEQAMFEADPERMEC